VCSSVQAFSTASHEARSSTDFVGPEHWMSGGKKVPQRTNLLNSSFPRVGGSDGGREEVEGYSLNISNCPPDLPDSAVLHGVFVFAHHRGLRAEGEKRFPPSRPSVFCKLRLGWSRWRAEYQFGILGLPTPQREPFRLSQPLSPLSSFSRGRTKGPYTIHIRQRRSITNPVLRQRHELNHPDCRQTSNPTAPVPAGDPLRNAGRSPG
jgi:hypothetical protein